MKGFNYHSVKNVKEAKKLAGSKKEDSINPGSSPSGKGDLTSSLTPGR